MIVSVVYINLNDNFLRRIASNDTQYACSTMRCSVCVTTDLLKTPLMSQWLIVNCQLAFEIFEETLATGLNRHVENFDAQVYGHGRP